MAKKIILSSSKKLLISSLLIGMLIIGGIISLVLVLAANQQSISTSVSVTYVVDGVGAKTSAKYYVLNMSNNSIAKRGDFVTESGDKEIIFDVDDAGAEPLIYLIDIHLPSTSSVIY